MKRALFLLGVLALLAVAAAQSSTDRLAPGVRQLLARRADGKAGVPTTSIRHYELARFLPSGVDDPLFAEQPVPLALFGDADFFPPQRDDAAAAFVSDSDDGQLLASVPELAPAAPGFAAERVVIWRGELFTETDGFEAARDCLVVLSMNGAERVLSLEQSVGESQRRLLLGLTAGRRDVHETFDVLLNDAAKEIFAVHSGVQRRGYVLLELEIEPARRLFVAGHSADVLALQRAWLAAIWPLPHDEDDQPAQIVVESEGTSAALFDFYRPAFASQQAWSKFAPLLRSSVMRTRVLLNDTDSAVPDALLALAADADIDDDTSDRGVDEVVALLCLPQYRGVDKLLPCTAPDYCLHASQQSRDVCMAPESVTAANQRWQLRWPATADLDAVRRTLLDLDRHTASLLSATIVPRTGKHLPDKMAAFLAFVDLCHALAMFTQPTLPVFASSADTTALIQQLQHGYMATEAKIATATLSLRTGPFLSQTMPIHQADTGLTIKFSLTSQIVEVVVSELLRRYPALFDELQRLQLAFELQPASADTSDGDKLKQVLAGQRFQQEQQIALKLHLYVLSNLHRLFGSAPGVAGILAGPSSPLPAHQAGRNWLAARRVDDCDAFAACQLSQRVRDFWAAQPIAKKKPACPNVEARLQQRLHDCAVGIATGQYREVQPLPLLRAVSFYCDSTVLWPTGSSVNSTEMALVCQNLGLAMHGYAVPSTPDFDREWACSPVRGPCLPAGWNKIKQVLQTSLLVKQPNHFWSLLYETI